MLQMDFRVYIKYELYCLLTIQVDRSTRRNIFSQCHDIFGIKRVFCIIFFFFFQLNNCLFDVQATQQVCKLFYFLFFRMSIYRKKTCLKLYSVELTAVDIIGPWVQGWYKSRAKSNERAIDFHSDFFCCCFLAIVAKQTWIRLTVSLSV